MATLTLYPTAHTGASNLTENTSYPFSNGHADASSSSYARIAPSGSRVTGAIYYQFDTSALPANAVITSVTCSAKGRTSSTSSSRISSYTMQMTSGTTLKGSSMSFLSTTASSKALTVGTWTRAELNNARILVTIVSGSSGSSSYYGYFYGATLTIEYELPTSDTFYIKEGGQWVEKGVSAAYKKVNGTWVQQTDMKTAFDTGTNYIKGN